MFRDRILTVRRAVAQAADAESDGRETWFEVGTGPLYRWSQSATVLIALALLQPDTLARVFEVMP